MSAPTLTRADNPVRELARVVLTAAVRGRRERGGQWGEAALAEFAETRGGWEAVRWAAGGIRVALRERRERRRQRPELPRHLRITRRLVAVVLIGLLGALAVDHFLLSVRYQSSGDMEPTLNTGGRWLLDRVSHRLTELSHGDVVQFTLPNQGITPQTYRYTKRIIGLPGDTITCRDGRVYRNGAALDEPYLASGPEAWWTDCQPITVPADQLYVLGDHRGSSRDSRHTGAVPAATVDGRMVVQVWPVLR